jgi:ribonucleoside-diphosphate reductase alpha chain
MTLKTQEYLGIQIDLYREKNLSDFSINTLQNRYFWENETYAQQAFARASVFGATYKEQTDYDLAQRLYNYASLCWFMFSTPILSNGGTTRGLPISCFLNYVPDSRFGLSDHYDENIWLASAGGGVGGYWGDVRSNGTGTSNGSKSTGGDLNRKCLNLHNGVNITNEFLDAVKEDKDWRLIDPKSKEAVKSVSARDLWWQILHTRSETGEPYIVNLDNCNKALPQQQKDLGLQVRQSNLCSEITLPTDEERTAVCCLSSVNIEKFDEWGTEELFIEDLVTMLDNVIEHFIESAVDTNELGTYRANADRFKNYIKEGKDGYKKSAYSAYRERSIGLGAMGFHSYLQSKGEPFEGLYATSTNHRVFKHIKDRAVQASTKLAESRGEAPDMVGSGLRNAHLLAVAPNASSSIICNGTSPSIEPTRANVYTHKTLTGSYKVQNKYLEKLLKSKKQNTPEVWKDISAHEGSVQHLDFLTEEEKEVFKTAPEINQIWIVEHAHQRQQYICQSQSVNLFFAPPKATESQDIHDDFLQYVNDVHWYGAKNLKSLYYLRSDSARNAENVNIKIPRINLEDVECIACEG